MDDKVIFARAMPPPVDVAIDGHFAGKLTRELSLELHGWSLLSVAALGLAGVLALLLALGRVPGAETWAPFLDQSFFQRGLVAHVTFAFVVWYLGVQGALTVLVTARLHADIGPMSWLGVNLGRLSLIGAAASFVTILVPVVAGWGAASPNNYIPVLVNPVYYAGLALLAASLAVPILRLLISLVRLRLVEATTFGVACAGVIYLTALACIALAWSTRPAGFDAEGLNDYLMWGGGHILQFANTALLLCALYLLSRVAFGETPLSPRLFKAMVLLLVAGSAVGPVLYFTHVGGDPAQRLMFTELYRYVLPLPAGIVTLGMTMLLIRRWADVWAGAPEVRGIAAALALFAYGGAIGFFESSVDTRTPAHYHAELIAVTLLFMALTFAVFLPLLGRRTERRRLRSVMYLTLAGGQFLHSTGLYVAGAFGVARKTVGAAQGLAQGADSTTKIFAMTLMGLGGVIAVVGGVIFIVIAGKLLLARRPLGVTAAGLPGAGTA